MEGVDPAQMDWSALILKLVKPAIMVTIATLEVEAHNPLVATLLNLLSPLIAPGK